MKLYDRCSWILENHKETRNSDKILIWDVFNETGVILDGQIDYDSWMSAPSTESIRRCRQKIQETHPELRADKKVQEFREKKQENFPSWVFREDGQGELV